jgi:hypothetical protein
MFKNQGLLGAGFFLTEDVGRCCLGEVGRRLVDGGLEHLKRSLEECWKEVGRWLKGKLNYRCQKLFWTQVFLDTGFWGRVCWDGVLGGSFWDGFSGRTRLDRVVCRVVEPSPVNGGWEHMRWLRIL